jgi:P4 family phage/plasmid primase-like protien
MEDVSQILENTRVFSDYYTHVSMIQPLGKFQINRDIIETFWDKYCTDVFEDENDEKDSKKYGVGELVQSYIPVLVDIDIKIKFTEEKDVERLYTEYQLESVVRDYQEVLKTILSDCKPENLYCFVLEKPAYKVTSSQTEYIKSGFHLHFPYTFLSRNDHEAHLIPRAKKMVNKSKIFSNLGFENSGDLIDACYTKAPWLLYGSRKALDMEPYRLSMIYNEERDEITLLEALKNYKLYDRDENEINLSKNPMFHLPRVLSVIPWHRSPCEVKPNLPSVIKINNSSEKKRDYEVKNLTQQLERAKKYISIMSPKRSEIYNDWMQIGWALYNISNGSEEGLMLWLDFSSKCGDKFDEAHCISVWEKMEVRNMTLGTLAHFAQQDNPVEYTKIVDSYSNEHIKQSLEGSHHDIAKACFERYGHEIVCSSIIQNTWYQFDRHKWKRIENGVYLSKKLSEDFVEIFNQKGKEIYEKMSRVEDVNDKNIYAAQQRQIQKMIANLKNNSYKTSVMKECREVFYNESFMKFLDKNPYLIGFKNGVYDLKNNMFRPGIPEDYISLQMPIEYSDYTEDDRLVKEVYEFFEKIFPNKNIRDYFMDVSSDVFVGGNHKKHVYFWSGEGNNGKSITQMFFEKMLGEYAVKLPTSLIVGKRTQSSQACPELVRAGNGVRWAILQEPDKKDIINIGLLKELSGNDTMYARGLFQSGGEIEPMFKLNVICNEPPSIPYSDKATWNRIRVIPFESTFCHDAPDTLEEQMVQKRFPIDPFFADKIPSLVKPFAWVLLNHKKKGIKMVDPDEVKLATDGYKKQNDVYQQFEDESIVDDPRCKITLAALYNRFKEWYRDSVPNQTIPVKNDVKAYFEKKWGAVEKGNVWKGKREMTAEDEDAEDVMVINGGNE